MREDALRRGPLRARALAAAVALALAPCAVRAAPAARRPGPLSPEAFERAHGLRVLALRVTAAGGLVDLRLRVTDARRASALLRGPHRAPRLVPQPRGPSLSAPHRMARALDLRQDAVSYLLYPNVNRAVRPGTRVAVAFGEVSVAPIVAR